MMLTKEKAQDSLDCLDGISRMGLPVNSLPLIMSVAQNLQGHINALVAEDAKLTQVARKKATLLNPKIKHI